MPKWMYKKVWHVLRGDVTKTEMYIYVYILLTAAYVVLTLALPPNEVTLKKYDITENQSRLLSLTVVVPVVAIWFTALYGFIRFKSYAEVIRSSKEGQAFNQLADGLMILAFGLPVSGIISAVLGYVSRTSHDLAPTAIIWRNYVSLVLFIAAFILISRGAGALVKTLRGPRIREYPKYGAFALIVLSSIYTALIVARPAGNEAGTIYYLPNWLIVITLAIPYLFVWHTGLLAAYRLYIYKNQVRGPVYRHAFENLARGIVGIIGVSIVLQFLTTITEQLNRLNLAPLLIVLYLLIALYAVGYGLVARGAKRLKKIEEV